MRPPRIPESEDSGIRQEPVASIREDLEALRQATVEDLPTIDRTAQRLAAQAMRESREGPMVRAFRSIRLRPWLSTAVAAGVLATLLLVIPISYTRTVGYEIQISLAAPNLDLDQVRKIAEQFEGLTQADPSSISLDEQSSSALVKSHLSARPRESVDTATDLFVQALDEKGIEAHAEVQPLLQRITNNLIAYASDRIQEIRIEMDGKTLAEIEDEIEARLEEVGFENPTVTVTQDGNEMSIDINGDLPDGAGGEGEMGFRVTVGQEGTSSMSSSMKMRSDMTDEEIRDSLIRQLQEQGVDAEVVVEDGEVISVTTR